MKKKKTKIVLPKVTIYTDGSYRQNTHTGGWAAYLECEGQHITLSGGARNSTNNRMEMTAVIEALRSLTTVCDVVLFSDSQYVLNGMKIWMYKWKKNNWHNHTDCLVANHDLWIEMYDEVQKMNSIHYNWVKGHNGDPHNTLVDNLAQSWSVKLANENR